jgi:hypothetical protein
LSEAADVGHSETWKILEEIIIELRKKGHNTPQNVMNDLKSAKTMIRLVDTAEEGRGEIDPKIEQYIASVEAYVITEAQKCFPTECIDEWLSRLQDSLCDVYAGQPKTEDKEETRFIAGLPRDQKWLRVTPISSLPAEKLKQLADETNLAVKPEKDTHVIVYGKAEDIKLFIKKMTEQASKETTQ